MNILVTGGYGFIGYHFLKLASKDGRIDKIINLDCLTYAAINVPHDLKYRMEGIDFYGKFIRGNISNRQLVKSIIEQHQIDSIVNFAAETHVDNSIKNNTIFLETNVNGVMSLLECYKSIHGSSVKNKFIQVSTDEVFGHLNPKEPPFNENTPYNPRNPYSATKAAADHLVSAYTNTFKLNTAITHCTNNFGEYQHPEKLIPKVIHNALNNLPIPIYGSGEQIRDWIYAKDHARGILDVLTNDTEPGSHWCFGSSTEMKNINLTLNICSYLDLISPREDKKPYSLLIHFVDDRKGHDVRYAIDSTKARAELNWSPQDDFQFNLHKTIKWYLSKHAK